MVLAVWDMCSSFYVARAMIGRKKKQMAMEKKKNPCLDLAAKQLSFFAFSLCSL